MSIIYGQHASVSFLKRYPERVRQVYILTEHKSAGTVNALCQPHDISCVGQDKEFFQQKFGDAVHQGVALEIVPLPVYGESDLKDFLQQETQPFLLILDSIQDPHNLGACLRTACAAGVDGVIVPKDKAASLTSTVRKVACGGAEVVPFYQVTNLARTMRLLQKSGVWIYGLAGEAGASVYETNLKRPLAIAIGAEHAGLRRLTREHCDQLLSIPMPGAMESLNVSVATGITLFEVVRLSS